MRLPWLIVYSLILVACSGIGAVPFPPDPAIPEALGVVSAKMLNSGHCPELSGEYSAPTQMLVIKDKSTIQKPVQFSDYFGLFPWGAADKQPAGRTRQSYLVLSQPSENYLVLDLTLDSHTDTYRYEFRETESDFYCDDGAIRFPERQSFGGIEGTNVNGQIRVSVRRTIDGALILLRTHGVYKARPKSDDRNFTHEVFRFDPVKLEREE